MEKKIGAGVNRWSEKTLKNKVINLKGSTSFLHGKFCIVAELSE